MADTSANYLNGEEEFQELLDRLRREAEQTPMKEDLRNYLGDNADIEQILELINQGEAAEREELAGFIQEEAPAANLGHPNSEEDENSCPICYESMDTTTNTTLECGHVFHRDCLHSWARHDELATRCPMCRRDSWLISS